MKIIGAGFGRSGTMSIKSALEQLGYGPCYHMKITLKRYHHMRFFMRAWRGKQVNWKRFFQSYNSVVDWPTCAFYRELMTEFPDARILLNVRDPGSSAASAFIRVLLMARGFTRIQRIYADFSLCAYQRLKYKILRKSYTFRTNFRKQYTIL